MVPVVAKESSVYCTIQKKHNDQSRLRESTDIASVSGVGFLPISLKLKVNQIAIFNNM